MTDPAINTPAGEAEAANAAGSNATVRAVPRIALHAFYETPETAAAFEAAGADRRMRRAHVSIHLGGISAARTLYESSATPNLIVLETGLAGSALFDELEKLAEVCDPGTKVVVIGRVNDIEMYRELMQRGVSEYLVAPVDTMRVIRTVSELYVDRTAQPLGRTIAFIGAKGGVGSSTLAHNVAWSIARNFDNDVVVADLDLPFGTAGLDFNQDPPQGIADAVDSPERLDDNFLDRLLAKCSDRLSLLAAPAVLDKTYDYREDAFEQIIDLAQAGVPAVILDLPHTWSAWVRRTLISADEVVVVAEPDLANLRNAKNLVDLVRQARPNDQPPRLVINKEGMPKRPEIKVEDFSSALELQPLAVIPFDAAVFGQAANNGQMVAETDAKSPVAATFDLIARTVTGRGEARQPKKSSLPFLSLLRGRKSDS